MEPDGKGVGKDLGVAEEEKINQYICSFKVFSIKLKPRNINQQTYLAYCNTYNILRHLFLQYFILELTKIW